MKRICVVKQQLQELSPIEVALDEMQMRVTELEEVVFMKPTDAKKLQLRLQVCAQISKFNFKVIVFAALSLVNYLKLGPAKMTCAPCLLV
jgi:hypothetical protein